MGVVVLREKDGGHHDNRLLIDDFPVVPNDVDLKGLYQSSHPNPKCSHISISCSTSAVFSNFLALEKLFRKKFLGQVITKGDVLLLDSRRGICERPLKFEMTIMDIVGTKDNKSKITRGVIETSTVIRVFPSEDMSFLTPPVYFNQEGFNLSILENRLNKLDIGGMALPMKTILEGIFGSNCIRLLNSSSLRLAARKVKGVLLHGPSHSGKTLLARNIHEILGTTKPKIIEPGMSHKELELLFADAIRDARINKFWRSLGRDGQRNQLHLFILEDLMARDQGPLYNYLQDPKVVTLMDRLDNILIIATTRPGRFELQVKLDYLSEAGRLDALKVFTRPLIDKMCIKENELNLSEIALQTNGYSAYDIRRVVRIALLYALERVTKSPDSAAACIFFWNILKGTEVGMDDFYAALDNSRPTKYPVNEKI